VNVSLGALLEYYIEQLQSIVDQCDKPTEHSDKCIQCDEKRHVIRRLKEIIKEEYGS
jgi:hypothetical protein